jgi:hypothetical protein
MHRPTPKQPPPVENHVLAISEVKIEEERKEEKKPISTEIIVTPRSSDTRKKSTF